MVKNILEFRNVSFSYKNKKIFENLSFAIKEGSWVSIVGPNGAGKSTIISLITGILDPSKGNIKIGTKFLKKDNKRTIRKKIGVVLENPVNQFVAETVGEDISFALGNLSVKRKKMLEKVKEIAKELNIEEFLEKAPDELSGGERQKVALAGVLVYDPKILILDESLSMLDQDDRAEVLRLLKRIQKERNLTIICVTHDVEETLYSDEILILAEGEVKMHAEKFKVYEDDNLMNKYGIPLPFMIDMSYKFKYYGLIDEVEVDPIKLVDKLWK